MINGQIKNIGIYIDPIATTPLIDYFWGMVIINDKREVSIKLNQQDCVAVINLLIDRGVFAVD